MLGFGPQLYSVDARDVQESFNNYVTVLGGGGKEKCDGL